LIALHANGRPLDTEIWTLLSFELWCRTFLDAGQTPLSAQPSAAARDVVHAGGAS
jgi:hypothetical protein